MKRTASAFVLLASLGGCMHADRAKVPATYYGQTSRTTKTSNLQGPYGEPIAYGNTPQTGMSPGLMNAGYVAGNSPRPGTNLVQAGYVDNGPPPGGSTAHEGAPGPMGGVPGGYEGAPGPMGAPYYHKKQGIVPVPAMGPPGAVAAIGALPAYAPAAPTNMRTSIRFGDPEGMMVTWYGPSGWNDMPLRTPARYNFLQGGVYRLKLSSVANRLDRVYYPTLEVVPGSPKVMAYLAHSSVPVTFTDEDFEQVDSGNFLVKVVYLPDPNYQDLATIVGPNVLVSTPLEPGIDPIIEAQKRGTILLIIRMGNIDLNAPNSPAMDAPNPYLMAPPPLAPPLKKDIVIPAPKMPGVPPSKLPFKTSSSTPEPAIETTKPSVLPPLP